MGRKLHFELDNLEVKCYNYAGGSMKTVVKSFENGKYKIILKETMLGYVVESIRGDTITSSAPIIDLNTALKVFDFKLVTAEGN